MLQAIGFGLVFVWGLLLGLSLRGQMPGRLLSALRELQELRR